MRIKPSDYLDRSSEPFEVEMQDGSVFSFPNPKAFRARILARLNRMPVEDQLTTLLGEEQAERLLDDYEEVDGYWIEDVIAKWLAHYRMPQAGNSNGS